MISRYAGAGFAAIVTFAGWMGSTAAFAVPITYTISGVASGGINGNFFEYDPVTLNFASDTSLLDFSRYPVYTIPVTGSISISNVISQPAITSEVSIVNDLSTGRLALRSSNGDIGFAGRIFINYSLITRYRLTM